MIKNKQHDFLYFAVEGFSNMFTHGFMSFAAIGITVACLLIMGTFALVAVCANATLIKQEEDNKILTFVDETYTEEEARALERELLKVPNVTGAEFVSKAQAMDEFSDRYPDEEYFQNLDPEILRDRFIISIEDLSLMSETKTELEQVEGIANVKAEEALSDGFIALRNVATIVCVALVAILFLVSVFIIANTIKLTTFDRRDEIAIMKMVGATNSFIRWPFVYEGFLLGLLSAMIAFLLQWGLYGAITTSVVNSDVFSIIEIVPFTNIWMPVAVIFLVAGMLIGIGGSVSAIRQFLKV